MSLYINQNLMTLLFKFYILKCLLLKIMKLWQGTTLLFVSLVWDGISVFNNINVYLIYRLGKFSPPFLKSLKEEINPLSNNKILAWFITHSRHIQISVEVIVLLYLKWPQEFIVSSVIDINKTS